MKLSTKSTLSKTIKNGIFGDVRQGKKVYDIGTLFKLYSLHEIKDLDKIRENWNEFSTFVLKHKASILNSAKLEAINYRGIKSKNRSALENKINAQLFILMSKIKHYSSVENFKNKKIFSGIVGEIIKGTNSCLLDVGSGPIPDTSFKLTETAKKVFAMDDFIIALKLISDRGVEPIEQMFSNSTNVSNYDIVVGKSPCSAIAPIVKVCSKTNTPYFLELCSCDLENQRMKNGQVPNSWKEYLPELDGNIKFFRNYAYSVDISKSQIENLIANEKYKNFCEEEFDFMLNMIAYMFDEIDEVPDFFDEMI